VNGRLVAIRHWLPLSQFDTRLRVQVAPVKLGFAGLVLRVQMFLEGLLFQIMRSTFAVFRPVTNLV
jgi:hypothetical protein